MAKIRTGTPDVKPDTVAHIRGVRQGNAPGMYERQPGHLPDDRSNARRSTGISPETKEPIMPGMPSLSPA
ncbi:hypothetical protein PJ985_13245 [Streptomyces sp. ACA25]|uniref:hypothetical protein n=1 Tax=Streptomyces sp. ACA25 TaxID=3022596 RepID=UPI0023080EED|nr:hypothetical protein [Streptomyces sp. ACA25]MDB1088533.1 hypothetical protein [Streptomyces sp. ACA25]